MAAPTTSSPPSSANATRGEASSARDEVLDHLDTLASKQQELQEQLSTLRDERDSLILRGLANGLSSTELAETAHLTGARVRAIADAAADSSARERISRAMSILVAHRPPICTTYGALAEAVGIGSAKGVASSLATNPEVPARAGARVLLLRWANPALGGYVIPSEEPSWQTQGDDTASRLDCLQAEHLVVQVDSPNGPVWLVPFDRVVADADTLAGIIG
ncbi:MULTISPECIES: hypothetical protein [unclassified Actinomyces]|uniref:hypothetical protein n=1 Tax=unclassified Actinomyces TaxID=2609248 RepID=UPI000D5A1E7B|nr:MULTISPECIES: hypothetical protein [unclassified Actinomyces]RAX20234.1 hypothetical protein DRB06_09175 [Actinomyces sp. Z5]RAX24514.1 hypothetical protein DRB07_00415 [Actinomyces sp. Z3]